MRLANLCVFTQPRPEAESVDRKCRFKISPATPWKARFEPFPYPRRLMFVSGNCSPDLATKGKAMIRTIIATLVTVGIFAASTAAQAASAPNTPSANGTDYNGQAMNGWDPNGTDYNGQAMNGLRRNGFTTNGDNWNGKAMNGGQWNGYTVNGNAVNGAEVRPGTVTIVDIILPDGTTFQAK
jgi:hypothetical protein